MTINHPRQLTAGMSVKMALRPPQARGKRSHGKSCSTGMKELRYSKRMDPRLEQLTPETIDRLAKKAQAEGLSLEAYLYVLLELLNEGMALAEMSEAEFEAFIEDFSKGSEHFPPLPPDFSRVDLYTNHG